MDRLFDETFAAEDNSAVSRNLWYGYVELYTDGEYGKQIVLDEKLMDAIIAIMKNDKAENVDPLPTEINWYLYGKTTTTDAIEDTIRPTIMIRYKQNSFLVRCNISDADFATSIDAVLSFENRLQALLAQAI